MVTHQLIPWENTVQGGQGTMGQRDGNVFEKGQNSLNY